jgi:hypothetical protein
MNSLRLVALILGSLLALPASASAQTYWLGRKPDPKTNEFVFDVAVPADLVDAITCNTRDFARLRDEVVKEFQFEVEGKTYTFVENTLAWNGNALARGSFALFRNGRVDVKDWTKVSISRPDWKKCEAELLAQSKPIFNGDWTAVTPILLKSAGPGNPKLKVNFSSDAPFDITRHPGTYDTTIGSSAPTKKPQIVPVVHDKELFVAWQTWDRTRPTGKVLVSKVSLDDLASGKMAAVREVPSGGLLVGFALDAQGADYILTGKAEEFENRPTGDFIEAAHKTWRKDVMTLHVKGIAQDLNSKELTDLPFYGLCNSGTGRLLVEDNVLAVVFARRRFSDWDNIIHQEADALVVSPDLSRVSLKAGNLVSHSFDQRLLFDGTDFIALHQADMYPSAGLLIQKLHTRTGNRRPASFAVFTCPTFGNDVYFELGGLAAEQDGYPVLFTATHNTEGVSAENAAAKRKVPWDLAMAYVVRDFDAKPRATSPFDVVGSGILDEGYAEAEQFAADNFSWNLATSSWTKRETRTFTRRVQWLTHYDAEKKAVSKATSAKLVKLSEGKYLAVWEQHILAGDQWKFDRTLAVTVTIEGNAGNKKIKKGQPKDLKNLRLHRGDDPVVLTTDKGTFAGWVTAGATNKQLLLHTLDEDLKYEAYPLHLP